MIFFSYCPDRLAASHRPKKYSKASAARNGCAGLVYVGDAQSWSTLAGARVSLTACRQGGEQPFACSSSHAAPWRRCRHVCAMDTDASQGVCEVPIVYVPGSIAGQLPCRERPGGSAPRPGLSRHHDRPCIGTAAASVLALWQRLLWQQSEPVIGVQMLASQSSALVMHLM